MARLTFGAYLVHPMIIFGVYMSTREALIWDPVSIYVRFVAFVFSSYAVSFVLWIVMEKPLMNVVAFFVPARREEGGRISLKGDEEEEFKESQTMGEVEEELASLEGSSSESSVGGGTDQGNEEK